MLTKLAYTRRAAACAKTVVSINTLSYLVFKKTTTTSSRNHTTSGRSNKLTHSSSTLHRQIAEEIVGQDSQPNRQIDGQTNNYLPGQFVRLLGWMFSQQFNCWMEIIVIITISHPQPSELLLLSEIRKAKLTEQPVKCLRAQLTAEIILKWCLLMHFYSKGKKKPEIYLALRPR